VQTAPHLAGEPVGADQSALGTLGDVPSLTAPSGPQAKAFGAFYTDAVVASFLVRHAVRHAEDRVMDPSFGGGVFLRAALGQLGALGGEATGVFGVELAHAAYTQVSSRLTEVPPCNLLRADFFDVSPTDLPPLDAIVGNPPFIRYQSLNEDIRKKAALRALGAGVRLSHLASSWAAFVVHSAAFLKPGGRLGMVLPVELAHAGYARSVLHHLRQTYRRVTLLTFEERLFPDLSQDTLLLLAEDKGAPFEGFFWRNIERVRDLEALSQELSPTERLPEAPLLEGRERLIMRLLPKAARDLYRELAAHPLVSRLGTLADVGIGYVTGANSFFHLSPERAQALGLAAKHLQRAVFRSAALSGLSFGETDWQRAAQRGRAGYLLHVAEDGMTPELRAYLETGEAQGIHHAYKCRVRTPWYAVPHVYVPDAFLTYMSGLRPQLVANTAGAVAPNTLHVVRFRPQVDISAQALAAFWQTSLTSLSAELEGHALGGGMLKLEPGEAQRVLIATPNGDFSGLIEKLHTLLRQGKPDEARALADGVLLQDALGLSARECALLRHATRSLRDRRYYRNRPPSQVE
jgi:adenine-specific DNA-methyltransferase